MVFTGCHEDENFTQLDDHFFLRNDGTDMPVAVQGNFADKTLIIFLRRGHADGTQAVAYTQLFNRLA